jgi:hypothetical protein
MDDRLCDWPSRNGDILPTNSELKPGSPTVIIRTLAKWCISDGVSKAAASSLPTRPEDSGAKNRDASFNKMRIGRRLGSPRQGESIAGALDYDETDSSSRSYTNDSCAE